MTDLRELVERLEAAEGPSRELDAEIARALGWKDVGIGPHAPQTVKWVRPDGSETFNRLPAYTASIDAALTLVPEGWEWTVGNTYAEGRTFARVENFALKGEPNFNVDGQRPPALALTIAALKAREADDAD